MNCNAELGFKLTGIKQQILYWKYLYWQKGISAKEFRNERISDIKDMIEIDNAFTDKRIRANELNKLKQNIRW
jgi:hypothetical protein